ncbi:MAG TPA: DUF1080 domain-containing protein [Tepidisphaeraceae bacterium]|nr:DUF1080 domain-containing protein [Tepidisphaeraceae bacterium]
MNKMTALFPLAGLILTLLFAGPALGADQPQWQPLFNGKNLDGWTVKCKPADRAFTCWRVEDGTILADSMDVAKHDYLWLTTNQEYSDFVLRLRFQAYRNSPGNSGVQIRSRYDDAAGWLDGPQIDINPPGPWRTGMIWDETRGVSRWLCPDIPQGKWVDESMAKPDLKLFFSDQQPAWNDLEITAIGMKLKAVLNGVTIMEYNGAGVLDDSTHKQRNVGQKGVIALQIHTGDRLRIRFKDIQIQDLSK